MATDFGYTGAGAQYAARRLPENECRCLLVRGHNGESRCKHLRTFPAKVRKWLQCDVSIYTLSQEKRVGGCIMMQVTVFRVAGQWYFCRRSAFLG